MTISPQQFVLVAAGMTASATLTAAIITWVKDRNAAARRIQAIDEATKYVAFWKEIKAQRELTATDEQKIILAQAFAERLALAERMVDIQGTRRQRKILEHLSKRAVAQATMKLGFLLGYAIPLILFTAWFTTLVFRHLPSAGFERGIREFFIAILVGIIAAGVRAVIRDVLEQIRRPNRPRLPDVAAWPDVGQGN